jgi:hypothetical protein
LRRINLSVCYAFTLDPCATAENATCPLYFTKEQDGLAQDWGTHRVFCNPPYGRQIGKWARKCFESSQRGALVALFVPAGPRSHLITRAADRSGSVAALAQRHVLPAVAPGHEPPGACLLVRAQRSPDLALKAAGAVHGGQSACLGSIQSDEPSCINSGHHVGDLVRTLHLRRRGAY